MGDESGGAGYKSVEHDQVAAGCCAEDQTRQRRDFEPSQSGEPCNRVAVSFVKRQSAADHFDFPHHSGAVETGASTGGFERIEALKGT